MQILHYAISCNAIVLLLCCVIRYYCIVRILINLSPLILWYFYTHVLTIITFAITSLANLFYAIEQ